MAPRVKPRVQVVTSHEAARQIDLAERAAMTKEERLALGADLHAFWVRNHFPDAARLDRVVQVVQRAPR